MQVQILALHVQQTVKLAMRLSIVCHVMLVISTMALDLAVYNVHQHIRTVLNVHQLFVRLV